MTILENLKYTKDHEWLKIDGDVAYVGITDFAQGELGEIVYVDVDTVGETIDQGEIFGAIEAVKTTSDLFMPVSGEILEFNAEIDENEGDKPELVNEAPYEDGWIVKIRITNPGELENLLDAEGYKAIIS